MIRNTGLRMVCLSCAVLAAAAVGLSSGKQYSAQPCIITTGHCILLLAVGSQLINRRKQAKSCEGTA
jgi:uncharacterized membrane protein YbjE (DUF340 family)